MKQYGALFTKENRLAIRSDRKTMTRRIPASFTEINERPDEWEFMGYMWSHSKGEVKTFGGAFKGKDEVLHIVIPWRVDDELYLKEPHYLYGHWEPNSQDEDNEDTKWRFIRYENTGVWYPDNIPPIPECKPCTGRDGVGWFKRSPMFMPKWAARDWLRVTDLKVERLQSIDELDALNEGTPERCFDLIHGDMKTSAGIVKGPFLTGGAVNAYRKQWEEINGKKHPWERNEWVVAYTFERIKRG